MFLDDLERRRGNTARTRNDRLAAIRSFLRHAAADDPLLLPVAQRVLAIPAKRFERASVGYLTREQIQAIVDSPDVATFSGQRDRVLLMLLYNTGAGVRACRSTGSGCIAGIADVGSHPRQRSQESFGAALATDRQVAASLAPATRRCARFALTAKRPWQPHDPLWHRAAFEIGGKTGCIRTSGVAVRPNLAPHDSAHDRHAPASVGRGPVGDRHVARPRNHPDDPPIPGCRLGIEEASPCVPGATPRAKVASIPPPMASCSS